MEELERLRIEFGNFCSQVPNCPAPFPRFVITYNIQHLEELEGKDVTENDTGYNVAIGVIALGGGILGSSELSKNVAIGAYAVSSTATNPQIGTVGIGYDALGDLTTGLQNTGVGYQALKENTTGAQNTAHGYNSLNKNTTGYCF